MLSCEPSLVGCCGDSPTTTPGAERKRTQLASRCLDTPSYYDIGSSPATRATAPAARVQSVLVGVAAPDYDSWEWDKPLSGSGAYGLSNAAVSMPWEGGRPISRHEDGREARGRASRAPGVTRLRGGTILLRYDVRFGEPLEGELPVGVDDVPPEAAARWPMAPVVLRAAPPRSNAAPSFSRTRWTTASKRPRKSWTPSGRR